MTALQDTILRHSRLAICATLNNYRIGGETVSGGRMTSDSTHFERTLELVGDATRKLFLGRAAEIAEGLLNLRQKFVIG